MRDEQLEHLCEPFHLGMQVGDQRMSAFFTCMRERGIFLQQFGDTLDTVASDGVEDRGVLEQVPDDLALPVVVGPADRRRPIGLIAEVGVGTERDQQHDHVEASPSRRIVQHTPVETGSWNHPVDVDAELDDQANAFSIVRVCRVRRVYAKRRSSARRYADEVKLQPHLAVWLIRRMRCVTIVAA